MHKDRCIDYASLMELTYMMRGTDGQTYGPVTLPQLTAWIQEGRVLSGSDVKRSDMEGWAPAHLFEELKASFSQLAPAATAVPSPIPMPQIPTGVSPEVKARGSWFYWIAGLSLINSIAAFSGGGWRFIFGLGITRIFDDLGTELGPAGKSIVLGVDIFVAAVFVLFGVFATKGKTWAFLIGTIVFALDSLIFVMGPDWISIVLHAFVLFRLGQGFLASRKS